jgi:hypothetical protein
MTGRKGQPGHENQDKIAIRGRGHPSVRTGLPVQVSLKADLDDNKNIKEKFLLS